KSECSKLGNAVRVVLLNFEFWSFELVSSFDIRISDLLPFALVNHELVPVGIAKLRHPANGSFGFWNVECHPAFREFLDRLIHISHFKRDRRPIARRLPRGMRTDTDGCRSEIVLDPCATHLRPGWLQLERFLIKLARAFLVGDGDGDECDLVNHRVKNFSVCG